MSVNEVEDEESIHQDDEDDDLNFAFMQNEREGNSMLKAQRARKTLKPSYIYLDSTSSFHQMFWANYMKDVRQVDVALRGKCNGGESHSDEKGCVLDMFCMWLVRSGIANLLSLPTLERDGYVCSYHTNSPWIVECPDGTILKFKRDNSLYEVSHIWIWRTSRIMFSSQVYLGTPWITFKNLNPSTI